MRTIKLDLQFFLVKFPIIFPLVYGFILYNFPQFETELIIITILLLAETHFGATWPFLVDKVNYPFIKSNRVNLVTLPVVIIILSLLGFFLIKELFLLIFFAANMYHVTRQSFGVGKLYCNDDKEKRYQELLIYVINLIFFRFHLSDIQHTLHLEAVCSMFVEPHLVFDLQLLFLLYHV